MKTPVSNSGRSGLTLVEVLLVIVIVAVIAMLFLPALVGSGKSKGYFCLNKLRQIDLCFNLFANDNQGHFPMDIPVTKGGTMEFIYSGHTFPHFERLKNYEILPQTLICPFETNRQAAASFEALNDLSMSYFVNADASYAPNHATLAGDRFLRANSQPVAHGLLAVTTNLNLSWTPNVHGGGGSMAFTDGHVEFSRDDKLMSIVSIQPLATNRFSIP